jgi:hypothetical protein
MNGRVILFGVEKIGSNMNASKIFKRISQLLALAGGTHSTHEANTAKKIADELADKLPVIKSPISNKVPSKSSPPRYKVKVSGTLLAETTLTVSSLTREHLVATLKSMGIVRTNPNCYDIRETPNSLIFEDAVLGYENVRCEWN